MLQPTTLSTASEEDPTLGVINTIGTTDSHLCYQGTTNNHKGQMHIFILIQITVILIIITMATIILLVPLEMSIIPVIIK